MEKGWGESGWLLVNMRRISNSKHNLGQNGGKGGTTKNGLTVALTPRFILDVNYAHDYQIMAFNTISMFSNRTTSQTLDHHRNLVGQISPCPPKSQRLGVHPTSVTPMHQASVTTIQITVTDPSLAHRQPASGSKHFCQSWPQIDALGSLLCNFKVV
jgi:hypothetical protein